MDSSLRDILASYDDQAPLDHAYTIPALWYTDRRSPNSSAHNVFGGTWQVVARVDQLREARGSSSRRNSPASR